MPDRSILFRIYLALADRNVQLVRWHELRHLSDQQLLNQHQNELIRISLSLTRLELFVGQVVLPNR